MVSFYLTWLRRLNGDKRSRASSGKTGWVCLCPGVAWTCFGLPGEQRVSDVHWASTPEMIYWEQQCIQFSKPCYEGVPIYSSVLNLTIEVWGLSNWGHSSRSRGMLLKPPGLWTWMHLSYKCSWLKVQLINPNKIHNCKFHLTVILRECFCWILSYLLEQLTKGCSFDMNINRFFFTWMVKMKLKQRRHKPECHLFIHHRVSSLLSEVTVSGYCKSISSTCCVVTVQWSRHDTGFLLGISILLRPQVF